MMKSNKNYKVKVLRSQSDPAKPLRSPLRSPVEHVLDMLSCDDDFTTILEGYTWLEKEDILACLALV